MGGSDLKARWRRFNGKLFHDATALPLNAGQAELLLQSAKADWVEVEPAIFGTLLGLAFKDHLAAGRPDVLARPNCHQTWLVEEIG